MFAVNVVNYDPYGTVNDVKSETSEQKNEQILLQQRSLFLI